MNQSPRRDWATFAALLVVADALALTAALLVAYVIRMSGPWAGRVPASATPYLVSGACLVAGWAAALAAKGLYRPGLLLGGPREYGAIFSACCYGFLAIAIVGFSWDGWAVSRIWLVLSSVLAFVALLVDRFAMRRFGYWLRRRGWFRREVVIVGANREGRVIAAQLQNAPRTGVHVVGFLDDYLPVGAEVLPGTRVLARPIDANGQLCDAFAEEFVVVPQALSWETMQAVVQQGVTERFHRRVKLAAGSYEMLAAGVDVDECARVPLLTLNRVSITGAYAVAKTAIDLLLASLLLVLALPALALVTLCGWLGGIRPVWLRQELVGRTGRPFTMYKLNAPALEASANPWLRLLAGRPGIRRLPGVFNVLKRDLSLVGPEPRSLAETQAFDEALSNVLSVRPGLWSLTSPDESPEQRLTHDLYYVRNFSVTLDLQILFRRFMGLALKLPALDISRPADLAPPLPALRLPLHDRMSLTPDN